MGNDDPSRLRLVGVVDLRLDDSVERAIVFCLMRRDNPPHRESVEHLLELMVLRGMCFVQALQRMLTILVTLKY